MGRILQAVLLTAAAAMLVALASSAGRAGSDKPPPWKPFLPTDDYQEVSKRSLERIRTLAKDDSATAALRAEALILAGYTISAKDAAALAGVRQKAIKVATLAAGKDTAAEARKLAAELTAAKGDAKAAKETIDWPAAIGDIVDVMTPLAAKSKGGDGIAVELQLMRRSRAATASRRCSSAWPRSSSARPMPARWRRSWSSSASAWRPSAP
jgi:hypothetical protein